MEPGPLLKKSRSGCTTCRARRVKCDEVRPACGNCTRRFVAVSHCDYGNAAPRKSKTAHSALPDTRRVSKFDEPSSQVRPIPQNLPLQPASIPDTSQWRKLELRLMHHYTAVVAKTMPNCNGAPASDMWERIIPQFAFDSEVVLSPLLALSALHLHAHSPSNTPMSVALTRYVDKSLVNHRQSLSLFDGELAEHVWLSAVVLASMYWLLAHQTDPNSDYELPSQAWTMSQGVSLLFIQKRKLLDGLGYSWFGYENAPRVLPTKDLPLESQRQLQSVEKDMADLLERFEVHSLPTSEQDIYIEAQAYVLYYYRAYYAGAVAKTLRRFIGTMTVRCRPAYRQLVESHDPLAMALLARLMVLMKGLEYAWWMNGRGDYEVLERDVRGMCGLMPKHANWAMEWPCRVLSGEVVLSRPEMETPAPVDFVSWASCTDSAMKPC